MIDRWQLDEDGNYIRNEEGPCNICGEWAPQRYYQYGYWVCEQCYVNSEDPNDYIDTREE